METLNDEVGRKWALIALAHQAEHPIDEGNPVPPSTAPPDTTNPPTTPPDTTNPPTTPPSTPPDTAGWLPLPEGTKRVLFPKGGIGGANGTGFNIDIPDGKRYRLRYEVMPKRASTSAPAASCPASAEAAAPAAAASAPTVGAAA